MNRRKTRGAGSAPGPEDPALSPTGGGKRLDPLPRRLLYLGVVTAAAATALDQLGIIPRAAGDALTIVGVLLLLACFILQGRAGKKKKK